MSLIIRRAFGFFLAMLVGFSTAATASPKCAPPKLDFEASKLSAAEQAKFTANFRAAYAKACSEGMFAKEPLIDPEAIDRSTLVVMNAPEANVTSIYFGPSAAPPAMLLESPFITPDGGRNIPAADDLHEAMYCAVIGSTEKEQEETGRCLPD